MVMSAVAAVTAVAAAPALPALAVPSAPRAAAKPASAPLPALLTQAQALARARQSGKPVAVTAATTVSSTLTANPDGTLTVTEQNMAVRKRIGGRWMPLDATLHRNADGSVSPAVTTGALRLSGGGTGPLAAMTALGRTLSLTFPGRLPAPVLSGPAATYAGVLPGVDLVVTADKQGGFDEVLVVRDAAAARNPALRKLAFRASVTGGLTLRTGPHGDLAAVNRAGRVLFDEPAPVMWDSRATARSIPTAIQPSTRQRVDLRDGRPVASGTTSPGENARTARVGARYSGGTLTYTPDASLLTGRGTVYPVYIDPWVTQGGSLQYWAQVDSTWPSQTYPKPSLMQVGYQGWQSPTFTARSFVTMSVPTAIYGSTTVIHSATLYLTDEWAPTCDTSLGDFGVQVWLTSYVGSSSLPTWSSQPSWSQEQQEKSFAHGYSSGCPAASEGFSVAQAAGQAALHSWKTLTFGIKANNESDRYGWKQFDNTASLSITFDKPPTVKNLSTSPSTTCSATDTVGKGDVILYATVGSPLSANAGTLSATFHATDTTSGTAVSGLTAVTGLGNGAIAAKKLSEGTLNTLAGTTISQFSWSVTVSDGALSTTSATCHFKYDPTTPGAPHITPEATSYTVGTKAYFDISPATGTAPGGYDYQLNGAAPKYMPASSGTATIPVVPATRTDVLAVTAISAGGNVGGTAISIFNAAPPANAADADMTGDGIPDLVTPGGGSTGLPNGLWLATQQGAVPGLGTGDGNLSTSLADLGQWGNGFIGDQSPSDFAGARVITGLFSDNGFQDPLVYYPSGPYAGQGAILDANGDGTPVQDMDAANATAILPDYFTTTDPNNTDPSNTPSGYYIPLQVANGYNADPNDSPAYPDLITINGTPGNYYLEYYQNGGTDGLYAQGVPMPDATPDGTMDWDTWQIATMAEPSGAVDMFLYQQSTGRLYLWQDYTITSDDPFGVGGADSYTSYQLSASWQPGTLSELRAADITGSGPALWAVTTAGTATAWTVTGLAGGTPAITAGPPQTLLGPSHAWRLGDATSGSIGASAATDAGNTTALPLSGHGGVTWNDQNDLFTPSAQFDGTTGYMTSTAQAVNTTGSFTVSAWVKPTILAATQGGVVLSEAGSHTSCMDLNISPITTNGVTTPHWSLRMSSSDSSGPSPGRFAATAIKDNVELGTWTHLTATFDATSKFLRLYVGGIPATDGFITAPATWSSGCNTFALGRYYNNDTYYSYFPGQIADVQIWNGTALTPTQVAAISGNPGYILFPSVKHYFQSAATSTTWQWTTDCGNMNFYQGLIQVKETCSGTATNTFGVSGSVGASWVVNTDGNIIIYKSGGTAIWTSGTSGNAGAVLIFQPDGNLVLYNSYGASLWASNTFN